MIENRKKTALFDRSLLHIAPLGDRVHDLTLSAILPLIYRQVDDVQLPLIAERINRAGRKGGAVILMMGAHVIRAGVQRYLIDMMEQGLISCIAMNGAGVIHDYEFAMIGATTESVARYIKEGYFGLWKETGRINEIISQAAKDEMGLGEAVGRVICEERFPHHDISLLAAGYRLGIPITVHVGIGCDIIHEFPNCDGGATGKTSYTDFLKFTQVMTKLEHGVVMNFGSSVMAPEIYLKALSMVRNVARQKGETISDFTTLVCDLVDLPADFHQEPVKTDPFYYFRPWKTMLVRTVADGGESFYIRGNHREVIPQLWSELKKRRQMTD